MHTEIGAFDAKSKLSELLRDVQRGQSYTITLRGCPIADLVPSEGAKRPNARAAIEAMRSIHKINGIDGATVSEWIAEGRR